MSSVDAWNATVTGMATAESLSLALILIYYGLIMAVGGWLAIGCFTNWSDGNLKGREVGFYLGRYLFLLIFTMFYF